MTKNKISLTPLENQLLVYLQTNYGDYVVGGHDILGVPGRVIASRLNRSVYSVMGIVGSLVRKGLLDTCQINGGITLVTLTSQNDIRAITAKIAQDQQQEDSAAPSAKSVPPKDDIDTEGLITAEDLSGLVQSILKFFSSDDMETDSNTNEEANSNLSEKSGNSCNNNCGGCQCKQPEKSDKLESAVNLRDLAQMLTDIISADLTYQDLVDVTRLGITLQKYNDIGYKDSLWFLVQDAEYQEYDSLKGGQVTFETKQIFFTEKEAEQYLSTNRRHFSKYAKVVAINIGQNKETRLVSNLIRAFGKLAAIM